MINSNDEYEAMAVMYDLRNNFPPYDWTVTEIVKWWYCSIEIAQYVLDHYKTEGIT